MTTRARLRVVDLAQDLNGRCWNRELPRPKIVHTIGTARGSSDSERALSAS